MGAGAPKAHCNPVREGRRLPRHRGDPFRGKVVMNGSAIDEMALPALQ
jgi:hypothetical protein